MARPAFNYQIKCLAVVASIAFIWMLWHLDVHNEVAIKARKVVNQRIIPGINIIPGISIMPGNSNGGTLSTSSEILPQDRVFDYCTNYRLKPADPELVRKRKVYDLVLINTELEHLEIRMGQMAPYVDYFVIIESDTTFTNHTKPLYVKENMKLFKRWEDKIIRQTMDLSTITNATTWDRETKSRDALFEQIFPTLVGAQAPRMDDVLLLSDADEVPKPETIRALRNCMFPLRTALHSALYYFSYQWKSRDYEWPWPRATLYKGEDTILPNDLRTSRQNFDIMHAAWHCSYCFSTIKEMIGKITSYSHSEYDLPQFKTPERIIYSARHGSDIFGRDDQTFDRVEVNHDIPEYIKHNRKRFSWIVDRDPPNANFRDHTVTSPKKIDSEKALVESVVKPANGR